MKRRKEQIEETRKRLLRQSSEGVEYNLSWLQTCRDLEELGHGFWPDLQWAGVVEERYVSQWGKEKQLGPRADLERDGGVVQEFFWFIRREDGEAGVGEQSIVLLIRVYAWNKTLIRCLTNQEARGVAAKLYAYTPEKMLELIMAQLPGNVQVIVHYWAGGRGGECSLSWVDACCRSFVNDREVSVSELQVVLDSTYLMSWDLFATDILLDCK